MCILSGPRTSLHASHKHSVMSHYVLVLFLCLVCLWAALKLTQRDSVVFRNDQFTLDVLTGMAKVSIASFCWLLLCHKVYIYCLKALHMPVTTFVIQCIKIKHSLSIKNEKKKKKEKKKTAFVVHAKFVLASLCISLTRLNRLLKCLGILLPLTTVLRGGGFNM